MDEATRAAILEGLAQAERGEFVSDEVVAEANKRRGLSQEQVEDVKRVQNRLRNGETRLATSDEEATVWKKSGL